MPFLTPPATTSDKSHLETYLRTKQAQISYFGNIASVLSGRPGIDVQIVDDTRRLECTNGKTIFIRNGDFTDPKYVRLVEGLIDHAAGHIRHTDFDYLNSLKLSEFLFDLVNAIEDVRMEKLVKKQYPGSAINLENMVDCLHGIGCMNFSNKPFATLVPGFVMLFLRFHANYDRCLEADLLITRQFMQSTCGEQFAHDIENLLFVYMSLTAEIQDVLALALKLIHLIEQNPSLRRHLHEQIKKPKKKEGSETDASARTPSDNHQTAPKDHGKALEKSSTPAQTRSDVQKISQDPLAAPLPKAIEIEPAALTPVTDLHEMAWALMNRWADEAANESRVDSFLTERCYIEPMLSNEYFNHVLSEQLAGTLVPLFKSLLISHKNSRRVYDTVGLSLADDTLVDAFCCRPDVFPVVESQKVQQANLYVMVDASHSMRSTDPTKEHPMCIANAAVYAMVKALSYLPLVKTQVDYFSFYRQLLLYRACSFGETPSADRFMVPPMASTPTASAIREAAYQLSIHRKKFASKDYFILISDGYPEQIEDFKTALHFVNALGIDMFTLVIGNESSRLKFIQEGFPEHRCFAIPHIAKLPEVLAQIVKQSILPLTYCL